MNNSAAQTFRRSLNQQHHGSFLGRARKIDRKTHLEIRKEKTKLVKIMQHEKCSSIKK